jgi:hypothetical protein
MQLARAREQSHPDDTIPIYEREVESLIETKKDAGYRDAVKIMVHIKSLLTNLERPDAFKDFVERVRTTHARKTNLTRRTNKERIAQSCCAAVPPRCSRPPSWQLLTGSCRRRTAGSRKIRRS